jgi:hypothetical protein
MANVWPIPNLDNPPNYPVSSESFWLWVTHNEP